MSHPRISSAAKEQLMKAFYLLAPLGAAALMAGCAYDPVYTTAPAAAPVAYVAQTPAYVVPNTVVMGAGPAIVDSDGDGYANHVDRWPYDSRFH
jgi:hypothetical protein